MDGPELFRIRSQLGLTQKQLAEKLGYDRNAIWRWERGIHPIRRTVALAVRALLKEHKRNQAE